MQRASSTGRTNKPASPTGELMNHPAAVRSASQAPGAGARRRTNCARHLHPPLTDGESPAHDEPELKALSLRQSMILSPSRSLVRGLTVVCGEAGLTGCNTTVTVCSVPDVVIDVVSGVKPISCARTWSCEPCGCRKVSGDRPAATWPVSSHASIMASGWVTTTTVVDGRGAVAVGAAMTSGAGCVVGDGLGDTVPSAGRRTTGGGATELSPSGVRRVHRDTAKAATAAPTTTAPTRRSDVTPRLAVMVICAGAAVGTDVGRFDEPTADGTGDS